jgi:hypothetical protein
MTRAELVDVSSGVESAPGVKDVDKIAHSLKRVAASSMTDQPSLGMPTLPNSAPSPTSAGISASSAAATSPRR